MWTDPGAVKDVDFTAELAPNCVGVVWGRIKHLNVPYLVRLTHDRRYLLPDQWVGSLQWEEGHRFFKARVKEALMAQGMDKSGAEAKLESAFVPYLKRRKAPKALAPVHKKVKQALRRKFNLIRLRSIHQLITGHHRGHHASCG